MESLSRSRCKKFPTSQKFLVTLIVHPEGNHYPDITIGSTTVKLNKIEPHGIYSSSLLFPLSANDTTFNPLSMSFLYPFPYL